MPSGCVDSNRVKQRGILYEMDRQACCGLGVLRVGFLVSSLIPMRKLLTKVIHGEPVLG